MDATRSHAELLHAAYDRYDPAAAGYAIDPPDAGFGVPLCVYERLTASSSDDVLGSAARPNEPARILGPWIAASASRAWGRVAVFLRSLVAVRHLTQFVTRQGPARGGTGCHLGTPAGDARTPANPSGPCPAWLLLLVLPAALLAGGCYHASAKVQRGAALSAAQMAALGRLDPASQQAALDAMADKGELQTDDLFQQVARSYRLTRDAEGKPVLVVSANHQGDADTLRAFGEGTAAFGAAAVGAAVSAGLGRPYVPPVAALPALSPASPPAEPPAVPSALQAPRPQPATAYEVPLRLR